MSQRRTSGNLLRPPAGALTTITRRALVYAVPLPPMRHLIQAPFARQAWRPVQHHKHPQFTPLDPFTRTPSPMEPFNRRVLPTTPCSLADSLSPITAATTQHAHLTLPKAALAGTAKSAVLTTAGLASRATGSQSPANPLWTTPCPLCNSIPPPLPLWLHPAFKRVLTPRP